MSKTEHTGGRVLLALGVLLAALFVLSFCLGRYGVDAGTTCRILLSPLLPLEPTWTDHEYAAVLNIRLPRIVLACLVGCCLSSAGAAYQGVFQNPMASPDVLGASSGASFGAALAILVGVGNQGTTLSAFFWSLATVVLVYLVGQRAPGDRVLNLVLAGMVISSLFTAATSYLKLVADPTSQLPEITYWLMGSLSGTRLADVARIAPAMAAGLFPLFLLRWKLNLLTLGDDEARAMGSTPPAAFSDGGVRHAGHRRLHRGQRHDRMGGAGGAPPVPQAGGEQLQGAAALLHAGGGGLPAAGGQPLPQPAGHRDPHRHPHRLHGRALLPLSDAAETGGAR